MTGFYGGGDGRGGSNHTLHLGRPNFFRKPTNRLTQYDFVWSDNDSATADAALGVADTGDLIQNAAPGDETITFVTAGDSAGYDIGDRIFIHSGVTGDSGHPPQVGIMEYRTVYAVTTGVLELSQPIYECHRSDNAEIAWYGDTIGKARVVNLTKRFVCENIEINDLKLLSKTAAYYPGSGTADKSVYWTGSQRVTLNNFSSYVFWPKLADLYITNGCTFQYSEPDKCLNTLIMNDSEIHHMGDGGTSIAEMILNRSRMGALTAQRANWFEANDSFIEFGSNTSQDYIRPFFKGARRRSGGKFVNTKFATTLATGFVQLGYTEPLRLGSNSSKPLDTTPVAGKPTTTLTCTTTGFTLWRDQFWPGRKLKWQKSGGGYADVTIVALTGPQASGTCTVTVDTDAVLATNGEFYGKDWLTYEIDRCEVLTTQATGILGVQNLTGVKYDGQTITARVRLDRYNSIMPATSYQAFHLEKLVIDVVKPYTGADDPATVAFEGHAKPLDGSDNGNEEIKTVNIRVAGRREYCPGYALGLQTGDTTSGFAGGNFNTRLRWAGTALSERAAGTDDLSVMPEIFVELTLRRLN